MKLLCICLKCSIGIKGDRPITMKGFTLIESCVTLLIIGILASVAWASLGSNSYKAQQTEARINVGSILRSSQAYFMEKQAFTSDISRLGVGIKLDSNNYSYTLEADSDSLSVEADPNSDKLREISGDLIARDGLTTMKLCQSRLPGRLRRRGVLRGRCATGFLDLLQ